MADETRTYNSSTLQGYVSIDALRAGSYESKLGVAGPMTETYKTLADYEKRLAALEDLARKLVG